LQHIQLFYLPTSLTYCCYTTSGNINCCVVKDNAPVHRARRTCAGSCVSDASSRQITSYIWLTIIIGSKRLSCKNSMGQKTVFTRSAITPPKVNRFGWNLEHYESNSWGWTWQILGAIRAVATVWDAAEILFSVFGHVNNARFHRFPVGQFLWHLNTTTSISVAM